VEIIKSNQNQKVKLWNSLKTAKGRKQSGTYLLDGWHSVNEAIKANASFQAIIGTEKQIEEHLSEIPHGVPAIIVSDEVANHIADTNSPQGIFAQTSIPNNSFDPKYVHNGKWLFLDSLQDPGNIGTLIRTADAAGFYGVVLGSGSTDLYNPKLIRSMQGSQFHLKVINDANLLEFTDAFIANGINVYGTSIDEKAVNYKEVTFQNDFALILGNEGNGVSQELLNKSSSNLYIPIYGKAESLNVSVAGGILIFALI
jgi:TrmH family RNA methyltransferase